MSDSEYQLVLDEVERFADQKEEIRNQTMQAVEGFACDQDGRFDLLLLRALAAKGKRMRHSYRWQKDAARKKVFFRILDIQTG